MFHYKFNLNTKAAMKTRIFASFNGVMQNDIQCMFHYKFNQNTQARNYFKKDTKSRKSSKNGRDFLSKLFFMYGLVRSILLRNFERGFIELIICR